MSQVLCHGKNARLVGLRRSLVSVCTQVPKEDDIWFATEKHRESVTRVVRAKQDRISGGARNDRPHSSSGKYPSEIQCVQYGRVLEGQVRNTDTPGISGTAAELHRVSFLGEGLLRQHGRNRRTSHPRLHSTSGRGRNTRGGATTAPAIGPKGAFTRFIDPFEGSSPNRVLWARYLINNDMKKTYKVVII